MTSQYVYLLGEPTHFGNTTPNLLALHSEVASDASIMTDFLGIDRYGDQIIFNFSGNLSAPEESELGNLVVAHTGEIATVYTSIVPIMFHETIGNAATYKRLGSFSFEGSGVMLPLKKVDVVSYSPDGGTYSIRILDVTNGVVIAEEQLSNAVEQANEFTTLMNIPTGRAMLEIQGKKDGATRFLAWSATLYF